MDFLDYAIDFHKDAQRQGPGSDEVTKKALTFLPRLGENARILDIGCGTGAQTMVLANNTDAQIVAVDMLQEFLAVLQDKVRKSNLDTRVVTRQGLMDKLDLGDEFFDVVWSEGAIYNIGFEKGLREWRRFLREDGYIVVSEISWLSDKRPAKVEQYWEDAYPEIDTINAKLSAIEKCGYNPIAHFVLPENCWTEHYYTPTLARSEAFLEKHDYADTAKEFVEMGLEEIRMYEKYKQYYSYVFYIAKKV